MKFSLLYKNYRDTLLDNTDPLVEDMGKTVYDLSIDKAVWEFARNAESFNYFIEVLKRPLSDVEEINYRQGILMDFIAMPRLLEELRLIFKSYDSLQSDWHEMRSSIYVYGVPNTMRGILDCSYESLKVTAGFAKNTVSYFRSIHDAIEKYDVKSEGLLGIKKFCEDMAENASLDEISSIASMFQRDSIDAYEFHVKTETDEALTIVSSCITEAIENESKTLGKSFRRFLGNLGKTQNQDEEAELDMGEYHAEEASNVLNEALYELYGVLSAIAGSIYEFFQGLSGELSFYDTGLKYCRWLSDSGLPMCMPKLLNKEAQSFKANDIYDMQLILEGVAGDNIVKNPVRLEAADEGMLIRGDNSCGKTAYLRAIGTAQIFAQAGLPVCASGAGISIRSAVFTQFSSSEKDFNIGDVAGRFEGEVQDMARILDDIRPFSLVLLNETFQTTAYAEGAEGIKGILDVLPDIDSKFVFVTRLVQLFDTMDAGKIKMLHLTAEGGDAFKISRCEA